MYTQCAKCETVFKLSAEVLRAAGGQVRCGRCGDVFNALARLAEDSTAFSTGESPLEMEARADSILESVASLQVAQAVAKEFEEFVPPGVEIAQLEVLATGDARVERSMEFTLPPGELDRIFVAPPVPAPAEAHAEPEPDPEPELELEWSPHRRSAIVARHRLFGWLGAAIVAALLLMAQIVLQNRDWFVAHAQPVNLSAYQLRQWGVTGDPDANGILRVRASILNTAAQLQPYPLLRVTLADRFGKGIGTRDFQPAEYLGKPTARLLAPGERADATLEILDPGKNAEGFEIDVCLRGPEQRISCANDVAAQTKP